MSEIAIVEYHTGAVVLDTLVKQEQGVIKQEDGHAHWMVKTPSRAKARG